MKVYVVVYEQDSGTQCLQYIFATQKLAMVYLLGKVDDTMGELSQDGLMLQNVATRECYSIEEREVIG